MAAKSRSVDVSKRNPKLKRQNSKRGKRREKVRKVKNGEGKAEGPERFGSKPQGRRPAEGVEEGEVVE